MATTLMQARERAQARDQEQVAAHRTGPAADTLGHAAIHQARAGSCRVCDTIRETRPELFTPAGQATAADLHAWICGKRHKAGSVTARRCAILIDGWRDVAARNAAANAVSADDAWALLLSAAPEPAPVPADDDRSLAGWNAVIERSAAAAREPAAPAPEPAEIQPGDTVTFPLSATVTGIGIVREIDGDTVVIIRKDKSYRRPAGDVKRSHLSAAPAQFQRNHAAIHQATPGTCGTCDLVRAAEPPAPAMSPADAWKLLLN